jgi:hypothetical protein
VTIAGVKGISIDVLCLILGNIMWLAVRTGECRARCARVRFGTAQQRERTRARINKRAKCCRFCAQPFASVHRACLRRNATKFEHGCKIAVNLDIVLAFRFARAESKASCFYLLVFATAYSSHVFGYANAT